jgi:hypothetical protein
MSVLTSAVFPVLVKFMVSLLYTTTWWVLGRTSVLISIIFAVGTVSLAYINGRIISGRGPGWKTDSSGISPTQRHRTRPRSTMITSYDSRTDVNNALLLPGNRRT